MPSLASPAPSIVRAAGVTGVWLLSALPILFGTARCPSARFFHFACPGCGMSRALAFLAHGEVGSSLAMHPLALPTLLAQLAFAGATIGVTLERGSPFALLQTRYGRASVAAVVIVFALVLLLWIARMLGAFGGPVAI